MDLLRTNSLHGPSNRVKELTTKQKLRQKLLFGTDSENETNECATTSSIEERSSDQTNTSEDEQQDGDVLEITFTNDLLTSPTRTPAKRIASSNSPTQFVSPATLKRLAYVPTLLSPLKKTPQPKAIASSVVETSTHRQFVSSASQKRFASTQPETKRTILISPRKQVARIHSNPLRATSSAAKHTLSPLTKESERNAKTSQLHAPHNQRFGETQEHKHARAHFESSKQQQLKATEHQPKKSDVKYSRFQESHQQHTTTHTRKHALASTISRANTHTLTVEPAYSLVQRTVCNRERYEAYLKRERERKYCTPLKNVRFNPFATVAERNSTSAKTIKERIGVKEDQEDGSLTPLLIGRRFCTSSSNSAIIEKHNFASEIRIEVNADQHRTNSEAERQIAKSLETNESKPPVGTRVINLFNKHVPKGVHLAIAVDNTKRLSKNALKKITRNLASDL